MEGVREPLRVVGRYAIYSEIAAGGMATIDLGRLLGPVGFARTVAVKRLHPQYAKDPEFVSMFLDEARLAARVQHPNVVATIDVVATDGELFLIMDYVRGESLSKLLRSLRQKNVRVPPKVAAAIMCGFLHGLHAAHEAKNERGEALGLVHRDVSPQNVLVGADGIARVLDFGIAKAAGRIQVTRDGQVKGKLAYMPPEQLAGKEISRTVDVYASAVVMWETLTSERLFKGETDGATLAKILRDRVPSPSAVYSDLALFDGPLMRALSRDPTKRHATARELALELERCMGIASPTDVGEWVEGIVGPTLSAREDQIAEIESSSSSLRVTEASLTPESDSSLNGRLPSTREILAAMAAHSAGQTPPMGSPRVGETSVTLTEASSPSETGVPKPRGGELPTSDYAIPMSRRLPLLASGAGLVVMLAVVGIVLGGRFSASSAGARGAEDTRGAESSLPSTSTSPSVPDPQAPTEAESAPTVSASAPSGIESAPPPSPSPKPPPPEHTARPAPPITPHETAKTSAPPPKKNNCDPAYTIDAQGRHKYKRECM